MLYGIALGCIWLQVADMERALEFYQRLGFRLGLLNPPVAVLTSLDTNQALILLWERPGARPQPPDATGLYHVAFRLPSEHDLAEFLAYALQESIPLEGAADHSVSQALYLRDPDGNGIEIYADRPQQEWQRRNGSIWMDTRPLNIRTLLSKARREWRGMPAGTRVGHVHFRVASLDEAEEFLHRQLGFAVTLREYPGARFFAADGYHHHVGTNTWGYPRRKPLRDGVGLRLWSVGVAQPGWQEYAALFRQLPSVVAVQPEWLLLRDPWGSALLLGVQSALPVTPEGVVGMFHQISEVLP